MNSTQLFDVYFEQGAKEATKLIVSARESGSLSVDTASDQSKIDLLIVRLLAERSRHTLSKALLVDAMSQIAAANVPNGSKIVYVMLVFDLSFEGGWHIAMPSEMHVTGSELNWALLRALRPASPQFAKRVDALIRDDTKTKQLD